MKKLAVFLSLFFVFNLDVLHAEVTIGGVNISSKGEAASSVKSALMKYIDSDALVIYGKRRSFYGHYGDDLPDKTFFSIALNNKSYFSNVAKFISKRDVAPECNGFSPISRDDWDKDEWGCASIDERAMQCHLFFLDEKYNISAFNKIFIKKNERLINGNPSCIDIKAISVAKSAPDGLLITATYIDSSFMAGPGNMPDEYPTTVLLKLKEESPGKLTITQDDSCLGNPNRIASIAAARKRLEQCAKESK